MAIFSIFYTTKNINKITIADNKCNLTQAIFYFYTKKVIENLDSK